MCLRGRKRKNRKRKRSREKHERIACLLCGWRRPPLSFWAAAFELNSSESLTPVLNPRSCRAALRSRKAGERKTPPEGGELPTGFPCISVASRRARHLSGPRAHVVWAQDQRQTWTELEQTRRARETEAKVNKTSWKKRDEWLLERFCPGTGCLLKRENPALFFFLHSHIMVYSATIQYKLIFPPSERFASQKPPKSHSVSQTLICNNKLLKMDLQWGVNIQVSLTSSLNFKNILVQQVKFCVKTTLPIIHYPKSLLLWKQILQQKNKCKWFNQGSLATQSQTDFYTILFKRCFACVYYIYL